MGHMRYLRTSTGSRRYSVGWNLTDEGGAYGDASLKPFKRLEDGDWVWFLGVQK